ncbi:hypothetical protein PPL_08810 [Heterostelium album PN500]|uniref:Uncharacterized protein n=1 Tax=Heterostelium pallidum (strain ATCC 26659 / Pp 5 / PN500) TaxID=670386 RepID=D3BJT0_HETP5|nr:hypothetical protein PPL_08810 [Heterostelium album PN500]EFA78160.1 hypothetical protein PPL_08810 [Heterostelium album PN500]|eukprot:XP_020430286.1 hypothetical protein PPL_08810 [Heterostelium album PN500]
MDTCARLNAYISLLGSKSRALESWKLFVNESLIQHDVIMSIDEIVPLAMLQRLVVDFANERYPVNCGVSIGYTILSLLYVLKVKKDSYPLSSFSETLETKIKGIFEALLQTVLKSPYQPIRGIAYIAIVNYLQLTASDDAAAKARDSPFGLSVSGSSSINGMHHSRMNPEDAKSIERYNLILLAKVEDRFIRILAADCNAFASGWKIAALSCLQVLLSLDVHRGNRILKYIEDKGLVGTLIAECSSYLSDSWESVGIKELRLYEAQMSLLLSMSDVQLPAVGARRGVDLLAPLATGTASHRWNLAKHQTVASQLSNKLQANKIHYSLLSLLTKYTKFNAFSDIDAANDEQQEMKNKFEYTNLKEKRSLFEVEVRNQVSLICRDLILYCRRVSILPESKFGTICFNSSFVKGQQPTLTTMDLPLKYLTNCLVDFYQTIDVITFFNQNIDNYEQLSNLQYKSILQNENYQDLNVTQRNQLVLQKLKEKLNFYQLQHDLLMENIETLLVLIVSHAYYYTHSVSYLFTHPLVQPNSPPLLSASTSSTPVTTPFKQLNGTPSMNGSGSLPLQLSDLNANNKSQQQTPQSIFLDKKPTGTQKLMNYFFKSTQHTPSTPISSNSITTQSLSQSQRPQIQTPTSLITSTSTPVLSFDESRDFLTKLRNVFEKEIPSLNKRLFDSILTIPKKSIMIELLMRKLDDLFNKQ